MDWFKVICKGPQSTTTCIAAWNKVKGHIWILHYVLMHNYTRPLCTDGQNVAAPNSSKATNLLYFIIILLHFSYHALTHWESLYIWLIQAKHSVLGLKNLFLSLDKSTPVCTIVAEPCIGQVLELIFYLAVMTVCVSWMFLNFEIIVCCKLPQSAMIALLICVPTRFLNYFWFEDETLFYCVLNIFGGTFWPAFSYKSVS